jgi:type II secretory pathway component PulF
MAKFEYRARDEKGRLVTGSLEADNRNTAAMQFDSLGLFLVSIKEVKGASRAADGDLFARFRKVKFDDLIFLTRQLQTVIRAGIPLNTGLSALEEQTENQVLKGAIRDISKDVDKGQKFSDALARHKRIFSESYISMVRTGEEGGTLEEVLGRLSTLMEFQMKTREMLKAALRYPTFVVSALILCFVILVRFVVPRFTGMFKAAKVELPLPTRLLMAINDLSQDYGIFILLGVVALVVLFVVYKKTAMGALTIDRVKLQIPIVGPIILKICMARFANMFENLVKTGVPVVRALDIVAHTVGNEFVAQKIGEIGAKIEKGKGITKPLKEAGIFPPLVIHLISTGEETGSLEEMLKEISNHYDLEVSYSVNRLSAWIEPILTVGLGGMVLFLALALFMPWWNMMGALKGGG